jgi:hypothetical protein
MLYFKEILNMCLCVKYKMVWFNMSATKISILASEYDFKNMNFFGSKTESTVLTHSKPRKWSVHVHTFTEWTKVSEL